MHLNETVSPSATVFWAALVVSLTPSGLSKNLNQIISDISSLIHFACLEGA